MNGSPKRTRRQKYVPLVIPRIGTAPGREPSSHNYKQGSVELLHAVEVRGEDPHIHGTVLYEKGVYMVPDQISEDIARYLMLRRLALPYYPSPWSQPQ